jgi:hypothetical protein
LNSFEIWVAISRSSEWFFEAKMPRSISFLIMSGIFHIELFGEFSDRDALCQRDLCDIPEALQPWAADEGPAGCEFLFDMPLVALLVAIERGNPARSLRASWVKLDVAVWQTPPRASGRTPGRGG